MPKSSTRRSKVKYPGLDKSVNLKSRWEYLDQDYIDQLSDSEKKFLSNFNEEFYSGQFKHDGAKLHKTKKEKRECYSRNNARNRDISVKNKSTMVSAEDYQNTIEKSHVHDTGSQEDALIALIEGEGEES